ncbi:hypothetical protein PtrSN002B_005249 [Pyrenophora tritici-repentis]|uniref:DUF7918 domain-containing protein n=2 Tax=Pyrenophora tritici-repentis TaxID=45151 RepID=A0A2W1DE07_9PLEO|nr:uncharacterized protein PTRG_00127 [Pyrenophora tritici-repentis Pt-1C-BFP]KAA8624708.1 hypothetical protein PtrV1_00388 [Pyrenophora tritici-repentis]EDU39565.1 conserved hypothetical protein [Pyrenophora tritici-repentis Pt-1C-BFP]KAF7453106.1 hypothetical protein A1F99_003640 [Pyrenophora tritici-repentis]KAF7576164.1 hypothetical protein PtrM4_004040 [Pyrenophora tritici-repentis]KAG9377438.1 hypothetical protein A1F94_011841 [Pyrenophora tritici-repentis]
MHYRSIDIGLHSQFDIETLPEYLPDPRDHYVARGITGFTPDLVDNKTSTCSVYVPAYPGSTFWIGYSVSPPVPEGHYFLFKLYVDGAYVTSWSTGKAEKWQGKTMFGLFETPEDEQGKKRIEKRVLCFTPPAYGRDLVDMFDKTARVEIRVHRADGRKRIERQAEQYTDTQHAKSGKGISLVSAGRAGPEQPKRFYKFALIDPIDQPFATFRYYYRTWDQLRDLGLLEQDHSRDGEENDLSVIEPLGDDSCGAMEVNRTRSSLGTESEDAFHDCTEDLGEGIAASVESKSEEATTTDTPTRAKSMQPQRSWQGASNRPVGSEEHPRTYVPRGAPDSEARVSVDYPNEQTQRPVSRIPKVPNPYRLSIPPSIKLAPPEYSPRPLPTIPRKSDDDSPTSYRPHPAYPMDNWNIRTPSPVRSVRDGISTPPLGKRREQGRSASALMGAITAAWRRRGQTPGRPSTESSRSVS